MSKPTDIPNDVIDAAAAAYIAYVDAQAKVSVSPTEDEVLSVAAMAILAERERCANIAANWRESQPPMVVPSKQYRLHDVADEIAHAIRNPRRAKGGEDSGTLDSLSANNANFKRVQVIGSIE
jgi:acyl-CoA reductase-like NAD-dependent aldehyde dehydrogenase